MKVFLVLLKVLIPLVASLLPFVWFFTGLRGLDKESYSYLPTWIRVILEASYVLWK